MVRFLHGQASLMRHMSGIAAGYLISVTLVRILPESVEQGGPNMALWALAGFLLVHFIEHGISPHFHYGEESHDHSGSSMTGILALLGLSGGLGLYVASSDLLPEAAKEKGWKSTIGLLLGVGLFLFILWLAPHHHH